MSGGDRVLRRELARRSREAKKTAGIDPDMIDKALGLGMTIDEFPSGLSERAAKCADDLSREIALAGLAELGERTTKQNIAEAKLRWQLESAETKGDGQGEALPVDTSGMPWKLENTKEPKNTGETQK